jgi:hypothetical protein
MSHASLDHIRQLGNVLIAAHLHGGIEVDRDAATKTVAADRSTSLEPSAAAQGFRSVSIDDKAPWRQRQRHGIAIPRPLNLEPGKRAVNRLQG